MNRTLLCLAASTAAFSTISLSTSVLAVGAATKSAEAAACIAMVLPVVQGVPGSAKDIAAGLRDLFGSYLTGPSVKVLPLETRLASQAGEEAQQKGCEPLLLVTLTRKAAGKSLMKAFGQVAGNSSWALPGGSTVASSAARVVAVAGLQTASSLASSTKAKDEVQLEYRLQSAHGETQFGPSIERQTANVDGEDLLTPIVTRAAEAIVTWQAKKK